MQGFLLLPFPQNPTVYLLNSTPFFHPMNQAPKIVSIAEAVSGRLLLKSGVFSVSYASSIRKVAIPWDEVAPADNVYLQRSYLTALEESPPQRMHFGYLVFYKKDRPVGVAVLQVMPFRADRSLNEIDHQKGDALCFFRAFGKYLKSLVASKVEFSALICGNLLVTGEHGFYFDKNFVREEEVPVLIERSLLFAQHELEKSGHRTEVIFMKDFFEKESQTLDANLIGDDFHKFCVQPSMIFQIRPDWVTFEDYLLALSSKYRVRAKRAFKKAAGLEKRTLNESQVWAYGAQMYTLYQHVVSNADFNTFHLHPDYFTSLKQHLGDRFQVYGYFSDDRLIGFYSTLQNGTALEAHFLGYDPEANIEYQLYLNMLFEIIQEGIALGAEKINFARTALEIKSSVGAEPHQLHCYIRHSNPFANRFMKPLIDYLQPEIDWIPRNPFKE